MEVKMEALELIRTRRSTRKFKETTVGVWNLEQIIDAGRHAPSGGNNQSTHFFVVMNKKVLDELAVLVKQKFSKMEVTDGMYRSMARAIERSKGESYIFHYNAPVMIIVANKVGYGNAMADCACALENMMVMCNGLDLGSCWINQLKWLNENPVLLEYMRGLGLAEDERVFGALAVGYADTPSGLPNREPLPRTGNPVTVIE